ncbi:hypothetical protein TRAPUB_13917 [Trametes pubescens]|uniref:Uncharacterized protein n=1 Tax=Trametes pubescens TaxID=154538 RepID=A0A1M2VPX4_TRAPU|nr:hypothetical protein TRAPUB_13917 [Trametes pubescens]
MNPTSPNRSPRSPTEFGTGPQHSDFLGIASQEDQLQELNIFSPQYGFMPSHDRDFISDSLDSSASFSGSDFPSPWPSNSLHLFDAAPASSSTAYDHPTQPLHDSYYDAAPSFDNLHAPVQAPKTVPRIHVETELANLSLSSLDTPAFERSPTTLMPTPTYSHSSPSSSLQPVTPQTPYTMSPFTPYIRSVSGSPHSHPELTIQPGALEQESAAQNEHKQEYPHVLQIAQRYSPSLAGEIVPQPTYRPHTQSDRRRYVEQVELEAPILFFSHGAMGIPLADAISSRFMHLQGRDDPMFAERGPSVSIRLNWPGYAPWSRQIPTRDFRSPPHPVTRAKLARNVAKTIKRFIDEMSGRRMEDSSQGKWRVGGRHINLEDLMLVGLQHVSMGSWQAHVRLVHFRH